MYLLFITIYADSFMKRFFFFGAVNNYYLQWESDGKL